MRIGLGLSGSPGARLCQRRGLSAVGRPLVAFYASLSPGSARLLKCVQAYCESSHLGSINSCTVCQRLASYDWKVYGILRRTMLGE